jgi:hypothetical protein
MKAVRTGIPASDAVRRLQTAGVLGIVALVSIASPVQLAPPRGARPESGGGSAQLQPLVAPQLLHL